VCVNPSLSLSLSASACLSVSQCACFISETTEQISLTYSIKFCKKGKVLRKFNFDQSCSNVISVLLGTEIIHLELSKEMSHPVAFMYSIS